jgi:hypothetical protein
MYNRQGMLWLITTVYTSDLWWTAYVVASLLLIAAKVMFASTGSCVRDH